MDPSTLEPTATDPFHALLNGDAAPLRSWLASAGMDVEALWGMPRWNAGGDPMPHRRMPDNLAERADQALRPAFDVAARTPGGVPRLLAYLYHETERAWQVSYHYPPMWATLRGAQAAWTVCRPATNPGDIPAAEAILALITTLDLRIQIENAMNNGLLRELARLAFASGGQARTAQRLAAQLAGSQPAIARYVGEEGRTTSQYDDAFGAAAHGVAELLDGGGTDQLDEASAVVHQAHQELLPAPGEYETDHFTSLRALRTSLREVRAAQDRDWLSIDAGRIVYVYPFALRGLRPDEAVERAGALAGGWDLCGVVPGAVHLRFNLDDIWHGSDADQRRFDGTQILLPEVTLSAPARPATSASAPGPPPFDIATPAQPATGDPAPARPTTGYPAPAQPATGDPGSTRPASGGAAPAGPADGEDRTLATLLAEVRLSRIGNHYLRFEGTLVDADPQDVYTALMRAAPEHGRLEVTCGEGPRLWPRLADLAIDLIEALAGQLGAAYSARPGMFQVLLGIHAASVGRGPAAASRREVGSLDELTAAVGSGVLCQPVPNMISTVAEWIRYPDPDWTRAITGVSNLRGHVVLRTCNTTVQIALGLPQWCMDTAGTIMEFAASLEGLFTGWFDVLDQYYAWIGGIPDAEAGETVEELRERVRQLRVEQFRLHRFITEARSTLALIRSPALVTSPLVADQLVTMVEAAGAANRSIELERKAGEVLDERLSRSIETLARQRAERDEQVTRRQERRQRAWLETLLAVIAAVGVSGLGQIYQAGYDVRAADSWWIIGMVSALALLVGGIAWLAGSRNRHDRPPADVARVRDEPADRPRTDPAPVGQPAPGPLPVPRPRSAYPAVPASVLGGAPGAAVVLEEHAAGAQDDRSQTGGDQPPLPDHHADAGHPRG